MCQACRSTAKGRAWEQGMIREACAVSWLPPQLLTGEDPAVSYASLPCMLVRLGWLILFSICICTQGVDVQHVCVVITKHNVCAAAVTCWHHMPACACCLGPPHSLLRLLTAFSVLIQLYVVSCSLRQNMTSSDQSNFLGGVLVGHPTQLAGCLQLWRTAVQAVPAAAAYSACTPVNR